MACTLDLQASRYEALNWIRRPEPDMRAVRGGLVLRYIPKHTSSWPRVMNTNWDPIH